MRKIRLCLWATNLQANMYTLARRLGASEEFEVVVVTDGVEEYRHEPINALLPVGVPILDRDDKKTFKALADFKPDLTIIDNHYPPKRISEKYLVVWHGFGWRGPENRSDFKTIFSEVKSLTRCRLDRSNPRFMWCCAGPSNYEHRRNITEIHEDNLRITGQAYLDDIANQLVTRDQILKHYPESFAGKKIALLALTWHYGKVFAHWGDDLEIFERMFAVLKERNIAMIIRMHDRRRFEPEYLEALERMAADHGSIQLKYKDDSRDNLLDIWVSDFMISNYSSMITYYYPTLRPSIHIYPVKRDEDAAVYRVWKKGKVREVKTSDPGYIWSLPSEENGGLVAFSEDELHRCIGQSVDTPDCCREKSLAFMEKHLAPVDGHNTDRVVELIREMVAPD